MTAPSFAWALLAAPVAVVIAQAPPATPPPAAPASQPSPTATPTTLPTLPTPTPTPLYRFVYRPAPSPSGSPALASGGPEIDEIDLNDSAVVPPSPLHVRVLTSAAVVSVAAQSFGRSIAIPQKTIGEFTFDGYIPQVPFFLRNRTFSIQFVATVPDGRTASITLPLTLH